MKTKIGEFFSCRRVIYEYDAAKDLVTIHCVGKRRNIYEMFEKLLKKIY